MFLWAWRKLCAWGCLSAMLAPKALRDLSAQGFRRPCWFPGHGGSCAPWLPVGYVGSRGMAGPVCSSLLPAMLVPKAWRQLWAWGCPAVKFVARTWRELLSRGCRRPFWFSGYSGSSGPGAEAGILVLVVVRELWAETAAGHVRSKGMAGALVPRLLRRNFGSQGMGAAVSPGLPGGNVRCQDMAGAVAPGLPPAILVIGAQREWWARGCRGHFGSRGSVGAVGLGLPPAMFVPRAWQKPWAWSCHQQCWYQGHDGSCGHGAAGRSCWFPGHGGSCGPGAAGGHFGSRGMAGAVGPGLFRP